MGDLQDFSRQPNGVVMEDCPSNPDLASIEEGGWGIAEETTQQVVCCIHPTLDSEEKRKDVIEYVQKLIRFSLGCEVFPYGSVPLKTYLPDGDIDLTALCSPNVEETLARNVLAVLQVEEQNEDAEYEVKDTQFIDAEVKLVKCLVQNIVIDISFNQLGGLCTLCFLEQVDRLVGRDHLFKRSIILIKAWCYYEKPYSWCPSWLISTYALETLVLYIFNLFHSSLNGPLAVLYRFLDYFSEFDWDNYCISLKGPVRKSSLPDIVVEMPVDVVDNLLLSEEFIRNCMDMFSVPSRGLETNVRAFPQKNLNIIDPLKENNNLGRSVHIGNFYRIRSAFKYGARKLGRILLLPRERIADEIKGFFATSIERHGRNFSNLSSSSHSRTFSEEKIHLNSLDLDLDNSILKDNSLQMVSKVACTIDEISVSGFHLSGEAGLRIASDTPDSSPSSCGLSDSLSGLSYHAPPFHFSRLSMENGIPTEEKPANVIDENLVFDSWMERRDLGASKAVSSCCSNRAGMSSSGSGISSPDAAISESLTLDFRERDLADIAGSLETLNPLSDLNGDYDSHIRSLLYGQCCQGYALSAPVLPTCPNFPSQFQNRKPWKRNTHSQMNTNGVVSGPTQNPMNNPNSPSQFQNRKQWERNGYSQRNTNGVVSGLTQNSMNNPTLPNSSSRFEEKHKPQGTGTFFLDSNGHSYRKGSSQARGWNHHQFQRHIHNNDSAPALKSSFDECSHELPHARSHLRHVKSGSYRQSTRSKSDNSHLASFSISSHNLEFGSLGHFPGTSKTQVQSSKAAVSGNSQKRVTKKSFDLKNEDHFPPLTISMP
ncbi:uncharacterized protein LOC130762944 isoform X1 [Actinidia eriantha]|uniref:uncharacterized protein LOC130762944 isoform X1 n=1 Tax=Actinidia eriantha TaxID=165200 RepID=UPI002582F2DD|nr:uncharacterized protein LOC130762944 isoform X1 [Actinidia eriantha]XP_057474815.1 uncharacterized protein LOC130762944 isoform X1 [Actinidia eriantha]